MKNPHAIFNMDNYVGVSKNRGTPKWMVYFMENPIQMDDLGVPLFLETPMCLFPVPSPFMNSLGILWDPLS